MLLWHKFMGHKGTEFDCFVPGTKGTRGHLQVADCASKVELTAFY